MKLTIGLCAVFAVTLSGFALLTACQPSGEVVEMHVAPPAAEAGGDRFSVVRVGTFHDSLAYGNYRGIYLITDRVTGAEFLGVSGVGISEVGSHQVGDVTVRDER